MNQATFKKGQTIELRVDSAAYEGFALGRLDGLVVFVRDAVPGDRVRAVVRKKKKNFLEAGLEEVLEPSPHRVKPRCRHFGVCGGCRWQNADYGLQLEFKREQVRDILERIGGFKDVEVRPTLASPDVYFYRNKMEFSFGAVRWLTQEDIESGAPVDRSFALGLHVPKRFDRILDLHECHLQSELSARLVNRVRELAKEQGWSPYDARTHQGYLRNLVIRTGVRTGQVMVNLVTRSDRPDREELFAKTLAAEFPEVTTSVCSVNATRSPVAAGQERVLSGDGTIAERIGDLTFRISPTTFFQPNTLQAERLYETVREFAGLTGSETLYDLYSGIGCIGLFLAGAAGRVVGAEQQERAVGEARRNALENEVDNAVFHAADSAAALSEDFLARNGAPDVLVVDPPRVGLSREVRAAVLKALPSRLVYVSCNPATQARDLDALRGAYEIRAVQPVDMFPHTYHIENVAALSRRPEI